MGASRIPGAGRQVENDIVIVQMNIIGTIDNLEGTDLDLME